MKLQLILAGNVLAQLLGKFITAGATLLINIVIARQYGLFGYGEFTKITTYVSVFYLLVDFGVNAIFLQKIHDKEKDTSHLFTNLITLRIFLSFGLVFIALSVLSFLPYDAETQQGFSPAVKLGIIILVPTVFTQALLTTFNALFQNALRYDKSTIAVFVGSLTTLMLVYVFTYLSLPLMFVMGAFVVGGIVLVLSCLFLSRTLISFSFSSLSKQYSQIKLLLISSLPLGITLLFNVVHFRADIFILTMARTTEEVGIYGMASKFFEFPLTIPSFIMNALYPIFLKRLSTQKDESFKHVVREAAFFMIAFSLIIAVIGFVSAPLLSYIKQDFALSIVPFRILVFTLPLFFLSSLIMWVLIAQKRLWTLVWVYGIGMVVNIVLNLIFTTRYGYNAAAAITGISEGVVLLLLGRSLLNNKKITL